MKSHQYQVKTEWTGNTGSGTSGYATYSRDHDFSAEKKSIKIPGSSDPSFRGDSTRYNPEELLVSSVSGCHMLWYLHLCASNGITVTSYLDEAEGAMNERMDGSGFFESVVLYPVVKIKESDKVALAESLHQKANEMCFIANSCNFPIHHKPKVEVE